MTETVLPVTMKCYVNKGRQQNRKTDLTIPNRSEQSNEEKRIEEKTREEARNEEKEGEKKGEEKRMLTKSPECNYQ